MKQELNCKNGEDFGQVYSLKESPILLMKLGSTDYIEIKLI